MKKEKKKGVEGMRKFLSILVVLMLVFTFLPRIPISFGATLANPTVTIKNITLTPDTVGEITRIDIEFKLSDSDLLANSDNIQIIFPQDLGGDINKEFTLPSAIPTTAVLIDGSNNIVDVQVDLMNRKIAIITSINVPKDIDHTLTILPQAGIKNPTRSGFYKIKVQTNKHTFNEFSVFVRPGVFDHVEISPDPAFVESNHFPSGDTVASFGNHTTFSILPKDMHGNTIYKGYTHGFGTYVKDNDDDCGFDAGSRIPPVNHPTTRIPPARWVRISSEDVTPISPAEWKWGIDTGWDAPNRYTWLEHRAAVGDDDTSIFLHPIYNRNLSDFTLEVKIAFNNTNYHGGVKFRFNGYYARKDSRANGYYVVLWHGSPKPLRFIKAVNGAQNLLADSSVTVNPNTWYHIKIVANGNNFKIYFWKEGDPEPTTPTIEATDPDFNSGIFGLWQFGGDATARKTYFDNFVIKDVTGSTVIFSDDFERKISTEDQPIETGVDANFRYCDSNGNGHYDCMDCIYYDADNSKTVTRGDIRITGSFPFGGVPGTVVKSGDSDIGRPLEYLYTFPNPQSGTTVRTFDEDEMEPIVYDNDIDNIYEAADDTVICGAGLLLGNEPLSDDPLIKYHDDDGVGTWDNTAGNEDPVVYDINDNGQYDAGIDVVIYDPSNLLANGDPLSDDSKIKFVDFDNNNKYSIPVLTSFSANEKYVDVDGGGYSPADWIYKDVNNNNEVDSGDIRLSNIGIGGNYYKAGTTVGISDADVDINPGGNDLTPFPSTTKFVDADNSHDYTPGERIYDESVNNDNVIENGEVRIFTPSLRYYDTNSNDMFDPCDFIYLDLDNSRTVSACDIRMTPVSIWTKDGKFYHYEAGTSVKDDGINPDFDARPFNPYTEPTKFFELKDIPIPPPDGTDQYYPVIYRFFDTNNNVVWDDDEPIAFYLDFKDNGLVDSGDLRISTPFVMNWSVSLN